jgi:hypothetical protein
MYVYVVTQDRCVVRGLDGRLRCRRAAAATLGLLILNIFVRIHFWQCRRRYGARRTPVRELG